MQFADSNFFRCSAQICIRLFPLTETSLFRSEGQRSGNVLVTSSSDHSIRLWWKVWAKTILFSCTTEIMNLTHTSLFFNCFIVFQGLYAFKLMRNSGGALN